MLSSGCALRPEISSSVRVKFRSFYYRVKSFFHDPAARVCPPSVKIQDLQEGSIGKEEGRGSVLIPFLAQIIEKFQVLHVLETVFHAVEF